MRATDLIDALNTMINEKGDLDISVWAREDGEVEFKTIEGIMYTQDKVILVPIDL